MPFSQVGGSGGGGGTQGTELGYDQITGSVSIASSTEATGTTLITCAAHTFDGNPVFVDLFGYLQLSSVATGHTICLFEGATQITRLFQLFIATATNSDIFCVRAGYRFTPTAASHTYTITAFVNNTTGTQATFSGGAGGVGAVSPAFVRFTKV